MADESKFSSGFLNLEKASDQYSSQRVLEFWGYHNTYGEQTQSDTRLSDFSPLLRYMYCFDRKGNSFANNSNQPPLARNLNIFPTLGINLFPNTQIRFWDENAIVWNTGGG